MVLDTFKHQLTTWGPHNGVDLVNIGLIHVGEILMHLVTKFTVIIPSYGLVDKDSQFMDMIIPNIRGSVTPCKQLQTRVLKSWQLIYNTATYSTIRWHPAPFFYPLPRDSVNAPNIC